MPRPSFDVLIAGAGSAGLAAAIALLERGLSVVLLDPELGKRPSRAEMLPPAAEPIIARLGIEAILDRSIGLGPSIGIWDTTQPEILAQTTTEAARPSISLDRRDLLALLSARVLKMGGHVQTSRFCGVAGSKGNWIVTSTDQTIKARFLVDATGRPASLARRLGAQLLLGAPLVAQTFLTPEPTPARLIIEATKSGWWYALPMPCGGTMGFISAKGHAPETPTLLTHSPLIGPALKSDARNARLANCVGAGWLATGDAAAAFDPISSQGLFNALSGGFFAGNAAADAVGGKTQGLTIYNDLVTRTAFRTHHEMTQHYTNAVGQSQFWRRNGTQREMSAAPSVRRQKGKSITSPAF